MSAPLRDPGRRARRRVWIAAVLFTAIGLLIQWWRLHSLTASYDQGIFTQVLWNGLHGHPFESTLSSQLSTNVIHGGRLPPWATAAWASTSPPSWPCGFPLWVWAGPVPLG